MVSPRVGWALRLSPVYRLQAVIRTADGGRRWTAVTPAGIVGAPTVSLTASTPLAAALVVRQPNEGVSVWRTQDGGRTWTHGAHVQSRFPGEVQLMGERGWLTLGEGAAAGSSGLRILATDDAGRTWRPIMITSGMSGKSTTGALPFGCDKGSSAFATLSRGFAGGSCSGGVPPFLYATKDGGHTWHRETLVGMPRTCACWVDTPTFLSSSTGVLTAGEPPHPQRVYLTTNAGRSWRALSVRATGPRNEAFVDARHGWVVIAPMVISRTTDGGVRWTRLATPFDASQATIEFVSRAAGFALEGYPHTDRLWTTTDGGGHWRLVIARRA